VKLVERKSVIIFDEIQKAPLMRQAFQGFRARLPLCGDGTLHVQGWNSPGTGTA